MAREYTIGEACEELRVTRKTLGEWLEDEGLKTTDLPQGSVDKRERVLSRRLLTALARKHKRALTSDLEKEVEEGGARTLVTTLLKEMRALRAEVDGLREQLANTPTFQQFEELERRTAQALGEIREGKNPPGEREVDR
jgi:hypothetical protein